MKRLIIHPEDHTTDFLQAVYSGVPDATVIRKDLTQVQLAYLAAGADQIIMLGHGCGMGLFRAQWDRSTFVQDHKLLINDDWAPILAERDNTIGIWCHADRYFEYHGLKGFYTGMFVSEPHEATMMGFGKVDRQIDESNRVFADLLNKHIDRPIEEMRDLVLSEYGILALTNKVAAFNLRLIPAKCDIIA